MIAVIMAGGKGTRISSVASDIPKPMISIGGKTVLEHEIECLRRQGITNIILTVSHLAEMIIDYFKDGSWLGVSISYYVEKEPLGNAGALFRLRKELGESEDNSFLLLNADSLFDIDFNRMIAIHKGKCADVTLLTHPNSHPYDSGLIITNEKGQVESWLSKDDVRPNYYRNCVNAGIHILNVNILDEYVDSLSENQKEKIQSAGISGKQNAVVPLGRVDLDRDILKPLAGTGRLYSYMSTEYVKDMGTPDRYYMVCKDFKEGIIHKKNSANKQRAIFLDRDGTINEYVGFLRSVDELAIMPGVADAIKKINESGYLVVVVTNQPVVARGETTYEQLQEIHNKMETLLGFEGAYIDGIYFCPHHPHKGFDGEILELKMECQCRKPKPGMLIKAAMDLNIDLSQSWMIGDGENDMLAGKNAGCRTAYINRDGRQVEADIVGESLYYLVTKILE